MYQSCTFGRRFFSDCGGVIGDGRRAEEVHLDQLTARESPSVHDGRCKSVTPIDHVRRFGVHRADDALGNNRLVLEVFFVEIGGDFVVAITGVKIDVMLRNGKVPLFLPVSGFDGSHRLRLSLQD